MSLTINVKNVWSCFCFYFKPSKVNSRAGRVLRLTRSFRSKYKMVWHQSSTVKLPSHQFVRKVRSVQFSSGYGGQVSAFSSVHSFHELFRPRLGSTWLARFGSGSIQSIESPVVWVQQRSSSWSPEAEIPVRRPGVCRLGEGMVRFAGCAGLLVWGVVCCRSDAISVKNRLKRVLSVQFACLIGPAASSVRFGHGDEDPLFISFISVHSVQFTNFPALVIRHC